jgi:hypothetical protein
MELGALILMEGGVFVINFHKVFIHSNIMMYDTQNPPHKGCSNEKITQSSADFHYNKSGNAIITV